MKYIKLLFTLTLLLLATTANANVKITTYSGVAAEGQGCASGTVFEQPADTAGCLTGYTWQVAGSTCPDNSMEIGEQLSITTSSYTAKATQYVYNSTGCVPSVFAGSATVYFSTTLDPVNACPDGSAPVNGTCTSTGTLPPTDDAWCQANMSDFVGGGNGSVPQTDPVCAQVAPSLGRSGGCNFNIEWAVGGNGDYTAKFTPAGSACAATTADPLADLNKSVPPVNCIVGADGKTLCIGSNTVPSDTGENCGTVNGEVVCVASLPDNSCATTDNGSIVCVGDATPPPSLDGTTPSPTAELTTSNADGTTNNYNYYASNQSSSDGSQAATAANTSAMAASSQQIADNTAAMSGDLSAIANNTAQTAANTSSINQKLDNIASGQCGGPNQPACKTEEHEGETTGYPSETLPEQRSDTMYTRRYPDGLAGVWNAKKDQLINSAFIHSVVDNFSLGSISGDYPTWTISLDLGALGNYGTGDLSLPSWLWDVLSAIVLFSAALACRRIIFGG